MWDSRFFKGAVGLLKADGSGRTRGRQKMIRVRKGAAKWVELSVLWALP